MRLFPQKSIIIPLWQWVLFFVLLPVFDLFLFYSLFGIWLTVLSMFVFGLLGVVIAYPLVLYYWEELNRQLDRGETPTLPTLHIVLILVSVFFMVLPGMITSIIGLLFIFPLSRSFVVLYLWLQIKALRMQSGQTPAGKAAHSPEVLDV